MVSVPADVSREEDVVRMVSEAVDGLGGLDLYVNNVAAHWDEPVLKATAESGYEGSHAKWQEYV